MGQVADLSLPRQVSDLPHVARVRIAEVSTDMAHRSAPRLWAFVLVAAGLLGCGQAAPEARTVRHVPRPVPGDRVTPEVLPAGVWKAGRVAYLNLRCRVQGPRDTEPVLLLTQDVADGILPQASVTFLDGERELERIDALPTERSC